MRDDIKKKNIIKILFPAIVFLGLSIWCWMKPSDAYSDSERRKLEQFPEFTAEALLEGSFMTDFETYAVDQFPMRDVFRGIKSNTAIYGFGQKDVHDIYCQNGYLSKMEYPLKEDSLKRAADKFRTIYQKYLEETDTKVYFSIIPDKNYFLAADGMHLSMDYQRLYEYMQDHTAYMKYIDITKFLELEDYYKTDTHWRQEKLMDVAAELAGQMGISLEAVYTEKSLNAPFYGVYAGQSGLSVKGEDLIYLDHESFSSCIVSDYENQKEISIYDMEKAKGKDPYEMFLSGPISLITIENPAASTDKELIVFRDSFASALVPLLAEGYAKITLVDIRYLSSEYIGNWITFEDQDILFLYSTMVLNNSETLK